MPLVIDALATGRGPCACISDQVVPAALAGDIGVALWSDRVQSAYPADVPCVEDSAPSWRVSKHLLAFPTVSRRRGSGGSWLPCRGCNVRLRAHHATYAPVDVQDLSRDKAANESVANDPWIIQRGTLKGLKDMFEGVSSTRSDRSGVWC